MSFIKFFWREFKSDRQFNRFFILCASLGIVGLLLVESFKIGIEGKISRNAKNFIASDLSISTRRTLEESEIVKIEKYLAEKRLNYAKWTETYSLVTKLPNKLSASEMPIARLSDLNFVSTEFPFYGSVTLEGQGKKGPGNWGSLHQSQNLWISRDLSWELKVKVGDSLKVGETFFRVDGIILEDQFSSFRGFSLAPKIFLSSNFLSQTDLVKFGSTASFSYAIKLPNDSLLSGIKNELRELIADKSVKIVGPTEASEQVARSLNILADYLSLITLLTYLLSLVGLYYFTQHFLSKKLKPFSIYKAMGVKTSFLFRTNFVHLILLTMISVIISTSLILIISPFLEIYFTRLVGDEIIFQLSLKSLTRIMCLSIGGSLMALGPLFWGALQTPVSTIFQDLPMELKRIKFAYFVPLLTYIVILAVFLSNSFKVGSLFIGGVGAIVILAAIIFKTITTSLDRSSSYFNFVNRQASRTLSRYFTSSFTIFICLLLGMTLTTFIFQLESSLRQEFSQTFGDRRPDLFIFDLQSDQADKFQTLAKKENWKLTIFAPMIRARLIKINNVNTSTKEVVTEEDSNFQTREEQNERNTKNRGVNLSYRSSLSWSETLVEGKFNGSKCNPDLAICEISLEQSYARRLGVKVGDKLYYDVSGIEIVGIVTSLRTVKWTSFEPNFFILFQPGILEEAPKTYLSSLKVKNFAEQQKVFATMAENFPSVSLLEVSTLVKKITSVFDLMAIAIKVISYLSLFVAFVVLIAVSFNHLDLRKREMTLFNMLGLKIFIIKKIYTREFSFLIFFCLILSVSFGSVLTFIIMKNVFNSEIVFNLGFVITTMTMLGIILLLIVNFRVKGLIERKNLF
jgi:putative ABC transport system permease protein